jgi:hypothetical protein
MSILYFSEMTIGELLAFDTNDDFCSEKYHFLKFGKDWKAAYAFLKKNTDWYESALSTFDMDSEGDGPPEDIMEKILEFAAQGRKQKLKETLINHTYRGDWVSATNQQTVAEEYQNFLDGAFKFFKEKAKNQGFELRKARKKS